MNSNTFDSLFDGDRTVLQPTSLRMEAYGNNTTVEVLGEFHAFLNNMAVEVLEKFHAFFRWKGRVYRQLFYVTNVNTSPNLLSKESCYTLGVINPAYSMESTGNSIKFQGNPDVRPKQPTTHLD